MTAVVGRSNVGNVGVNVMSELTDRLGKMGLSSPQGKIEKNAISGSHRSAVSLNLPVECSILKAVNKFSPPLKADKQVPQRIISNHSSSSSSRATCGGDWR